MRQNIFPPLAQGIPSVDALWPCHLCGSLSAAWGLAKAHGEGSLWQMHSPFFSVLYLALNRVTVSCWNYYMYLIPILFSVRFRHRADRIADPIKSEKTFYLQFLMIGAVQRCTRPRRGGGESPIRRSVQAGAAQSWVWCIKVVNVRQEWRGSWNKRPFILFLNPKVRLFVKQAPLLYKTPHLFTSGSQMSQVQTGNSLRSGLCHIRPCAIGPGVVLGMWKMFRTFWNLEIVEILMS